MVSTRHFEKKMMREKKIGVGLCGCGRESPPHFFLALGKSRDVGVGQGGG